MNKNYYITKIKAFYHNDKYSYDNIPEEFQLKDEIRVKCKTHGFFETIAQQHLTGKGCPKCILSLKDIHVSPQAFEDTKKIYIDDMNPNPKISQELVTALKNSPAFEKQFNHFNHFFYSPEERTELFKEYYEKNPNVIETLLKAKKNENYKLKIVFTEKIMRLMKIG